MSRREQISVGNLSIDNGVATAVAGAATLNKQAGVVTTEALVTAAAGIYTLTLTNNRIKAGDMVLVSVAEGTSTTGDPTVRTVAPANGSVVIKVKNTAAAAALNGTLKVAFAVVKAVE
jgi:hypothetical protein